MSRTITFEVATQDGIIRPKHYILTTTPEDRQVIVTEKETGVRGTQKFTVKAGERQLWRLTEDFKLWGMPTTEKLALCGDVGFQEGPDTMHRVIRELYDMQGAFEKAQACSLPEKDYFFSSIQKADQEGKKYNQQDEENMWYWLASRCVSTGSNSASFNVFFVGNGYVNYSSLYRSYGNTWSPARAVRPETTLKSILLFNKEGGDGSYEHPWICLNK